MSREEIIRICETYLFHGLVERDPGKVLLAPDARRVEQGELNGATQDEISSMLAVKEPRVIEGIRNTRWIVEGDQAVVFYELETTFSPEPVHIAERFRVRDGLISEIEAIFHLDGDPPAGIPVPGR